MEFAEISKRASNLRKEGLYAEALAAYEELTFHHANECTEWEYWGHAYCLLKLGRFRDAETFCRSYLEKEEAFQPLMNILAWSIYYQYIRNGENMDSGTVLSYAEEIATLCKPDDKYSPFVPTVFQVTDLLGRKFPYPANTILSWITRLTPDILGEETMQVKQPGGKTMELASRREQYFMIITRALYENAQYEECIAYCEKALSTLRCFHYDNDVWFKRKKALCLYYMGNIADAIACMREVFMRKKDWFVRFELGEMLLRINNEEEGIFFLASAALEKGDAEKKLKLFAALASWFDRHEEHETALKHYLLIGVLRTENGWKEDDEVRARIEKAGMAISRIPGKDELLRSLQVVWEDLLLRNSKKQNGIIQKLLPNNKAGFICSTDGKNYYFELKDFKGKKEEATPGRKVEFMLEDGFDLKKQKPVKNAVYVRPLVLGSC